MYTAQIQNVSGEVLVLTGDEAVYQVVSILGLNPPKAQINTTTIFGLDGAKFNSSKLETRNIVITVKINGDIETNRQNLYKYFPTKQWVRFNYTNENRNVYIDGYVESVECDIFENGQKAQISILCPQPYFKSVDEIISDISNTQAAFVFPFSINLNEPIAFSAFSSTAQATVYNGSEGETGTIIEVDFETAVSTLLIRNTLTGDEFTLNYSFVENDRIFINTNKGQKSVTLLRNGTESNLFSALVKGSVFFQLAPGDNYFVYLADNGDNNEFVFITFIHADAYRGV